MQQLSIKKTGDTPKIQSDTLLSIHQVSERVCLSTTSIYRLISDGKFPRQVRIGRTVRWRSADLDQWMASL